MGSVLILVEQIGRNSLGGDGERYMLHVDGTDETTLFVVGIPSLSVIPVETGIQSVGAGEQI